MLRVWRPASASALETSSSGEEGATRVEEMLLEVDLGVPVLQLEAGRFVVGADDDTLAVLHPRSLVVYALAPADGGDGAGDAAFYTLTKQYEHRYGRAARARALESVPLPAPGPDLSTPPPPPPHTHTPPPPWLFLSLSLSRSDWSAPLLLRRWPAGRPRRL